MVLTARGPEQQSHGVNNTLAYINRDFLFDFQIPTRSIARTAFLCKALAEFVPQCSQLVAEVAGFASGGPPTADDAFSPSILATLLPASPA
jgi:hypothetical protein